MRTADSERPASEGEALASTRTHAMANCSHTHTREHMCARVRARLRTSDMPACVRVRSFVPSALASLRLHSKMAQNDQTARTNSCYIMLRARHIANCSNVHSTAQHVPDNVLSQRRPAAAAVTLFDSSSSTRGQCRPNRTEAAAASRHDRHGAPEQLAFLCAACTPPYNCAFTT